MTLEVGDHACILHQKFVSEKLHQFKGLGLMHISYRPCETSVRVRTGANIDACENQL